jgi:hypothetical protein
MSDEAPSAPRARGPLRRGSDAPRGPSGCVPTADDWALAAGTIPYEILTSVSNRVPRSSADDRRRVGPGGGPRSPSPRAAPGARAISRAGSPGSSGRATCSCSTDRSAPARPRSPRVSAKGWACAAPSPPPTFVISRVHPSEVGGPALVHVDAYRLGGGADIDDLDLDSDLSDAVMVVEWGRDVVEQLSDSHLLVELSRATGALDASGPQRGGTTGSDEFAEDGEEFDEPRALTPHLRRAPLGRRPDPRPCARRSGRSGRWPRPPRPARTPARPARPRPRKGARHDVARDRHLGSGRRGRGGTARAGACWPWARTTAHATTTRCSWPSSTTPCAARAVAAQTSRPSSPDAAPARSRDCAWAS